MERAKETTFCLSCHVMQPYGQSLYVDDAHYIPAAHFQNHRVPADQASIESTLVSGMPEARKFRTSL